MRKKTIETWKSIKGYEGLYEVSNLGRVKSVERVVVTSNGKHRIIKEKIKEQTEMKNGYLCVNLSKYGDSVHYIHILVATAFIPNPHGYTVVHHKNHNRSDNRVENLMWIDRCEHLTIHTKDIAEGVRKANSKRVDQIDKITGEVLRQWTSAMDVERELGYKNQNISACAIGKYKTSNGYIWKTPL